MRRGTALFLTTMMVISCERTRPTEPAIKATFGVLFGGQIQERRDIPFELDPTKQTLGFRVDFATPVSSDTPVEWRLTRPERKRAVKRGSAGPPGDEPEPGERGVATVRAGESRIERTVSFRPGDPLGLWNVRVIVSGHVVIDRPFDVYDPVARDRAERHDGG